MKKKQIFLVILAVVLLIFALPKAIWYFQFKSVNIIKEEPVGAAEENAAQAKLAELGFENYMFDALRPADKIKLAQLADEGYTLTPYCDEIAEKDDFIQCFLAVKLEKDGKLDRIKCYGMMDDKNVPPVRSGDTVSLLHDEYMDIGNHNRFLRAYRYNEIDKLWELYWKYDDRFYKGGRDNVVWFWRRTNTLNKVFVGLELMEDPNSDEKTTDITFVYDYNDNKKEADNSDITEITLTVDLT